MCLASAMDVTAMPGGFGLHHVESVSGSRGARSGDNSAFAKLRLSAPMTLDSRSFLCQY
jgi:hypothetical protein